MASLLVESAVRVTLIIATVAFVLKVMRIKSPTVLHTVWAGVAIAMLLLPAFVGWGPKANLAVLPQVRETPTRSSAVPPSDAALARPSSAAVASGSPGRTTSWSRPIIIFGLYLMGLGTLLLRIGIGARQVRRLAREAISRDGTLTHPRCVTPVTVGWFKPTVIVPVDWFGWPDARRDATLVHEHEHVRRHDPLFQGIALINRAVFWFHPLAWWLERHLAGLAEEACDLAVLSHGHDPRRYSEYLLDAARSIARTGGRMAVGMSMPGVRLSYRIRRILDSRRPARVSRLRLACAIAACAAATAISTAATLAQASSRVFESAAARRLGSPLTPLTRSDPAERATGSLDATYARGRAGAPPAKMHVDSVRQVSSPVPALMSSDPVERAAAACELGRLGSPTVIPLLIALLGDGAPLPRQIFCGTEPPFEDESWAPDYPEVLEPSPGEAATRALIALGDRAIAPLTETLAAAGDWRARKNAAWALAHRGQATAALTAALRDSAWQVRSEAAYALFQRGGNSRDVVEALSSALTDSAWQVREQATLALGSKGGPDTDVIEALLLALRDRSSRVRLAATAALCQRAESRAWTALLEALRDPDQSVRAGAARAIGSRARDPEVQLLIAARHDPDPRTREGAMEALRIVDQRMRGTTTNLTRIPIPFD